MENLDKYKLEVVTPEQVVYSGHIDMVVIPGADGEFGVLYGHIPVISSIKSGFISIYVKNEVVAKFFVADGFVEVTGSGAVILVDRAFPALSVKAIEIEKIIQDLEKKKSKQILDFDEFSLGKDIEFYKELLGVIGSN